MRSTSVKPKINSETKVLTVKNVVGRPKFVVEAGMMRFICFLFACHG